jgi:hypothetical protein
MHMSPSLHGLSVKTGCSQIALALGLALIIGCQTAPPSVAPTHTISCKLPVITPLPETKASQEKGGLEITIVPATYTAVRRDRRTVQVVAPNFGEALLAPSKDELPNYSFIQETITPQLRSAPDRLQFAIRVNNKLARVFRGQGAVVQVNVGGKLMPINRKDYAEFIDAIVPPRNEAELRIFGPAIDAIPDTGTIGIFIYDVVTATDTAGAVTEKQNYEWYFSYTTQKAEDNAVNQVRRAWMRNSALRSVQQ